MEERQERSGRQKNILMVCSDLSQVKGGMVSVVKNLLGYGNWEEFSICYIAAHVEGNAVRKLLFFAAACIKVFFSLLFRRADLLHLHVSERGSFYRKAVLLNMAKAFHVPVILHHHGAEFQSFYEGLTDRKKEYVRQILEKADCNIVLSGERERELLKKAAGARCAVIFNAVDVPEANPYHGGDAVVTLGRLGERKGTYDLIQAVRELDSKLPPDIRFWLCGDGETERVETAAKEAGIMHRIAYIGWSHGEEKRKLLSHAVCHVLPSYREVMPMSILETMAGGIPNISTDVGSIPDVISHGENGFLVRPGDIESLKEDIYLLCTDRKRREEISRNAYETAKRQFSLEAGCQRIKELYRQCIGNGFAG